MSERKSTPDILSELLTGTDATPKIDFVTPPVAKPEPRPKPEPKLELKPKAKSKAKTKPVAKSEKRVFPEKPFDSKKKCWEYRTVSFQDHNGWRPRFVDGIELDHWSRGLLLSDYLTMMGNDGWQLAGTASGQSLYGSLDKYQLFFMRRR